jgi:hypothetical protein
MGYLHTGIPIHVGLGTWCENILDEQMKIEIDGDALLDAVGKVVLEHHGLIKKAEGVVTHKYLNEELVSALAIVADYFGHPVKQGKKKK